MKQPIAKQLDHLAIVVQDTEEALKFYHDVLGLPVLFSERHDDQGVRLTHLDLGNLHLQLVEPLRADHPLQADLAANGERLHHLCFRVDNVPAAMQALPERGLQSRDAAPRSGTCGKQAAFVDPAGTRGILVELTG